MLKLKPEQMVTLSVSYSNNLGADVLGALGNRSRSSQGSTWDFQRNLRCWPKGAVDGNESAARRDVEGGSKFQEILAALFAASDEYRDGKRQPYPFATVNSRFSLIQTFAPGSRTESFFSHLLGQTGLQLPSHCIGPRTIERRFRQYVCS